MQRSGISSLIGAVLGLVYILVNASKLPDTPAIVLRILAILVFVGVYLAIRKLPGEDDDSLSIDPPREFDRRLWTIVAADLVLAVAGVALIAGPFKHEEASVAWISLVAGAHLVVAYRGQAWATSLGGAIAGCGLIGLVLAFAGGSDESVATAGGILPGAILLGASWWAALRTQRSVASRA